MMDFYVFNVIASLLISVFLIVLCTGKKKKKNKNQGIESTHYSHATGARLSGIVESEVGARSSTVSNTHNQTTHIFNENEGRRSHSASQASQARELPQPPNGEESRYSSASQRNSTDCVVGFASETSGDSGETRHASPKGRRLPTPPPEGTLKSLSKDDAEMQDDENMYARVEDEKKKNEPVRLKIKTLEIKEGSGDSSFYAKVADTTEEDTGVYAQVDDKGLELNKIAQEEKLENFTILLAGDDTNTTSSTICDLPSNDDVLDAMKDTEIVCTSKNRQRSDLQVNELCVSHGRTILINLFGSLVVNEADENQTDSTPSTSTAAMMYPTPEYASIDKVKKGASTKRKTVSEEPPAPPIPERNFDAEDEVDVENDEEGESNQATEAQPTKVPTYDKLCVRESLDHIRLRQEVEEERRQRYANLPCINGDDCVPGDVYAQIDETNPEAVYESLSQPGSADGTFRPENANIVGYSSIREVAAQNHVMASPPNANAPVDLQTRPIRQHHYEQIERSQIS